MQISIVINILTSFVLLAHPLIQVDLSKSDPKQGGVVWIKVVSAKPISAANIGFGKKKFKLFKNKPFKEQQTYHYISCLGVSRYFSPKKERLNFRFSFKDGSSYQTSLPLMVKSANFKKEYIKLKPKKYKLSQDRSKIRNESRVIGRKFNTVSLRKQFTGAFVWPVKGRITSEFGTQRLYNNKPGWSHSGIDISAKKGTLVKVSQAGTVIFSKLLNVHGNTVIIDHGWGIVSIYNHLDKRKVKINDKVKKGDGIGFVGSTGIATGDHLHFGVSVQGVRVNPKDWIETAPNSI